MPCSCGNTTCSCGIPCYCSEELCQCRSCELALHRYCKICDKPLITDIQTENDACSCFVGKSAALMLENRDNPQFGMGNMPRPVGYFVSGKLVVNVMIPVPSFPQFTLQRPFSLIPLTSVQAASAKNLPSVASDKDSVNLLSSGEEAGIPSTAELQQLDKSEEQSSFQSPSAIFSNCIQDEVIANKEACHSYVLQSLDEMSNAGTVEKLNSETESHVVPQEPSFYLPSMSIENTCPLGLTNTIWKFPNPGYCNSDSKDQSLQFSNPIYEAGPAPTKKVNSFVNECHQTTSSLNLVSRVFSEANSYRNLQMNKQSLDPTKAKQSDLESYNASIECSLPSSGNSNAFASTELANKVPENYLMQDKKLADISTDSSSFEMQDISSVQSQPLCGESVFAPRQINYPHQSYPMGNSIAEAMSPGEGFENPMYWGSHQIPYTTQSIPQYFVAPNNYNDQSSEENEFQESNSSSFVNEENEEIDPIPLYIDMKSTTEKMEKVLTTTKSSSVSSIFVDATTYRQNADENETFSNFSIM